MIGDTPDVDVLGAKLQGWESILVQTGIFQGAPDELRDKPTAVVTGVLASYFSPCCLPTK